jgi:hypothetical protein
VFGSTARRSRLGGLPTFAFALGGLLVAHAVTYLLAVPDPYHRDLVLRRTGHGYLPTLVEVALVGLVAGAAILVSRALGSRSGSEPRLLALSARLALIQTVAFVGQEVLERLVAHAPLAELTNDHVLVVGVFAQVVVALAGAALLRGLGRASDRVATLGVALRRVTRPRAFLALAIESQRASRIAVLRTVSVRAPPPR